MNAQSLLNYLSVVILLERNKYAQEKVINNLDKKIEKYEALIDDAGKVFMYQFDNATIGGKKIPGSVLYGKPSISKGGVFFTLFAICCMAYEGYVVFEGYAEIHNFEILALSCFHVFGSVLFGSIPLIIWLSVQLYKYNKNKKRIAKRKLENKMEYEKSQSLAKDAQAILPNITMQRDAIKKAHTATKTALEKCYNVNIIPNNYREIVPICMFYDYLLNKRTYSIVRDPKTSDIGAINMYEEELYKRLIISELKKINENLELIRDNQRVLYNALQSANSCTSELLDDINKSIVDFKKGVHSDCAAIEYQNEQIKRCNDFISFVTYQRYMTR